MAPSRRTMLASMLLLATTATNALPQPVPQPEPQGQTNSAMPFLSSTTEAWASTTTAANSWWTPSPSASSTQSQWDWTSSAVIPTGPLATIATTWSSAPYSNPFTIYTTMTDSRGVITGMPAVATSQPSQADVATICSGCSSVLSDQASWNSMVSSMYSTSTAVAAVSTGNATSNASSSASATRTGFSQSATGAASRNGVLSGGALLAVFGAVAAAL